MREASADVARSMSPRPASTRPHENRQCRPWRCAHDPRRLRRLCLDLPEVEEKLTWGEHPTFRVRDKIFAILGGEGDATVRLKATKEAQAALVGSEPETFSVPAYVGHHGWVRVDLERVDPEELRELVIEAWLLTAPKRVARQLEL